MNAAFPSFSAFVSIFCVGIFLEEWRWVVGGPAELGWTLRAFRIVDIVINIILIAVVKL